MKRTPKPCQVCGVTCWTTHPPHRCPKHKRELLALQKRAKKTQKQKRKAELEIVKEAERRL